MNRYAAGAIAGLAGTVAMTAAMRAMFRALPEQDRYPLPPRLITDRVVGPTGLMDALDEPERRDLTLALHYGYGAAAGALYPAVAQRVGGPAAATGIGYGLAVWGASYLGWIPALHILTPATRHPRARNTLMLAAHVVWGAVTGSTAARLMERPPPRDGVEEGGWSGGAAQPTALKSSNRAAMRPLSL